VIVDASFGEDGKRQAFLGLAARFAAPALFLVCRAAPELVRHRLECRTGDASDANWTIYQRAAQRWEAIGPATASSSREVQTDGKTEHSLEQAVRLLRQAFLME
jgi:predicted kinase